MNTSRPRIGFSEPTFPSVYWLSDAERSTLAEIGKRLGRAALQQVACVAKPDTILAWYWRLIARKFDSSKLRTSPDRPRIAPEPHPWGPTSTRTLPDSSPASAGRVRH
jgi:hypothetical protein